MISSKLAGSIAMLEDVTRRARAMDLGLVAYPVDDVERVIAVLLAGHRDAVAAHSTLEPVSHLDRALMLLTAVIDEPLTTLPGGVEPGWKGPSNLSLHQFRPDLSEKIAALLEETGR